MATYYGSLRHLDFRQCTSAVAPCYAGLLVRPVQLNSDAKDFGFLNSRLYGSNNDNLFSDITAGNNGVDEVPGYQAAPDWNPRTKLGSVIGTAWEKFLL